MTISLHQDAVLPCDAFFADCEAIFRAHGGRPHWGKLHTRSAARAGGALPGVGALPRAARASSIRHGTFANAYLRELFEID